MGTDGTASLDQYLKPIVEHKIIIGGIALAVTLLGLVAAATLPASYESTAVVLVSPVSADPTDTVTSGAEVDVETELRLVTSNTVINRASESLATASIAMSPGQLTDSVTASSPKDSRIIDIDFSAGTPELAQAGANAMADSYIAYRSELAEEATRSAKDALEQQVSTLKAELAVVENAMAAAEEGSDAFITAAIEQSAISRDLDTQQAALGNLNTISSNVGQVIDPAQVPSAPSGLGTVPIVVGALIGGLVLGCLAAFALSAVRASRAAAPAEMNVRRVEPSVDDRLSSGRPVTTESPESAPTAASPKRRRIPEALLPKVKPVEEVTPAADDTLTSSADDSLAESETPNRRVAGRRIRRPKASVPEALRVKRSPAAVEPPQAEMSALVTDQPVEADNLVDTDEVPTITAETPEDRAVGFDDYSGFNQADHFNNASIAAPVAAVSAIEEPSPQPMTQPAPEPMAPDHLDMSTPPAPLSSNEPVAFEPPLPEPLEPVLTQEPAPIEPAPQPTPALIEPVLTQEPAPIEPALTHEPAPFEPAPQPTPAPIEAIRPTHPAEFDHTIGQQQFTEPGIDDLQSLAPARPAPVEQPQSAHPLLLPNQPLPQDFEPVESSSAQVEPALDQVPPPLPADVPELPPQPQFMAPQADEPLTAATESSQATDPVSPTAPQPSPNLQPAPPREQVQPAPEPASPAPSPSLEPQPQLQPNVPSQEQANVSAPHVTGGEPVPVDNAVAVDESQHLGDLLFDDDDPTLPPTSVAAPAANPATLPSTNVGTTMTIDDALGPDIGVPAQPSTPQAQTRRSDLDDMVANPDFTKLQSTLRRLGQQGLVSAFAIGESGQEASLAVGLGLAEDLKDSGAKVLVVDMMIEAPTLHHLVGIPGEPGLTDVLAGRASLADAISEPSDLGGIKALPVGGLAADPVANLALLNQANLTNFLAQASGLVHAVVLLGGGINEAARHDDALAAVGGLIVGTDEPAGFPLNEQLTYRLSQLSTPVLGLISINDALSSAGGQGELNDQSAAPLDTQSNAH